MRCIVYLKKIALEAVMTKNKFNAISDTTLLEEGIENIRKKLSNFSDKIGNEYGVGTYGGHQSFTTSQLYNIDNKDFSDLRTEQSLFRQSKTWMRIDTEPRSQSFEAAIRPDKNGNLAIHVYTNDRLATYAADNMGLCSRYVDASLKSIEDQIKTKVTLKHESAPVTPEQN